MQPAFLLPIDLLKNLEDLNEEVDDVQVKLDGGYDILLGTQAGHDHLKHLKCNH